MSEQYDFDQEVDRLDTGSYKWEKYRGRDILPMWVADSDFAVLPEIQQAMKRRADHPVFGYTRTPRKLIDLIVKRLLERYGWKISPAWVVPLPGIVGALYLACRATSKPGDSVYLPQTIYSPFAISPGYHEMHNLEIPMVLSDQRLTIDLDWLERQPAHPGRLLLFCNPQNPGGTIYREPELRRLAQIVEAKEWIICSDEIHCDLVLDSDRRHIPVASLSPGIAERSITLMAPSKTFNMPGLGSAFAIVPETSLRVRMKTHPYIVPHVNIMGLEATMAAYEFGDEWNRQQCLYLAGNRDFLLREINAIPGLRLGPIEATYLAWIDVSALELDDPPAFFEAAGVGMSPGSEFGDPGFMRMNFACPRRRVEQAVTRIRAAVLAR